MTEPFCPQCYGKGWVIVDRQRRECIACIMRRRPAPDPEHRGDRSRDHGASTVTHPNGSLLASQDSTFCGAAMRAVLDINQGAAE